MQGQAWKPLPFKKTHNQREIIINTDLKEEKKKDQTLRGYD